MLLPEIEIGGATRARFLQMHIELRALSTSLKFPSPVAALDRGHPEK